MDSEVSEVHIPCEVCGSSDAKTSYTDGHSYCFSCETYFPSDSEDNISVEAKSSNTSLIPMSHLETLSITARCLTKATCTRYGYRIGTYKGQKVQVATYYNDNLEPIGQKVRDKDKNFVSLGNISNRFFGQHLFKGGKKLVITEGEIDCLSVSQVFENKYPVVSLPLGAGSALKTFKANYDWLLGFEEVIIMFDMDEAGQKVIDKVASILPPQRTKVACLPMKDANECLVVGKGGDIVSAVWNAKLWRPDGIINALEYEDEFFSEENIVSYPYPFSTGLTSLTQGLRLDELVLLTAGTGIGKSTTAREIAYALGQQHNIKVGLMMLEDNVKKTIRHLLSTHVGKPLHLLWNNFTDDDKKELRDKYQELYGTGNFVVYDHFGSVEGDTLINRMRYMIKVEGCKLIVLDHITIAISGLEIRDERKSIDVLMTQLRSLIEETGVGIVVVSHLKKTDEGKTHEEGGTISLDDLRGSGSLKQIPDVIIGFERNQQADDERLKNIMKVRLLKCRFTGETGLAGYVRYDKSKHRLVEVTAMELEEEVPQEKGSRDYGF